MRSSMLIVAALALAACGKKSSPPAAGSGSGPAVATARDAATAAAAVDAGTAAKPARAQPAALTKEVRATYKQHLAAGRKAAKAAQWPTAITELEAALTAIPGDDRALAELSFAAMSAGDAAKARRAGRQAVLAATDPKIKAAALYNLGRVEEVDAPAKAAALYRESLALRPNATVDKRLAALGTKSTSAAAPLPCATPRPVAEVCACLNQTTELAADAQRCDLAATDLADFRLARVAVSELGEESVMLLGKSDAGWSVVGALANVYNPGAFGVSEDWSLASATDERLGTHSLARFVGTKDRSDTDMGIDEVESETATDLVVCVRDNAGGPPTCPLKVVTDYRYTRERLGIASDDDLGDVADVQTKGLPIHAETKVSVELGVDGLAKVRAVQGRPDAAVLGDKRLW